VIKNDIVEKKRR